MNFYLVDDHPLVRRAIAMTLQKLRPSAKVIELERFSELQSAIIRNGEPSLFVIDLLLPGVRGTSAISDIRQLYADVPLAVISAMPANEVEETCIKAGADAYIEKSATVPHIMQVLHGLFTATNNVEPELTPDIKLSKRKKQLIVMLDRGMSNRTIADELDISEHTVKVHLWRLFRRVGVNSRTQAIHFARSNGLL